MEGKKSNSLFKGTKDQELKGRNIKLAYLIKVKIDFLNIKYVNISGNP